MDTELKHCPFCGGKAELKGNRNYSYVECVQCGAKTKIMEKSVKYCANDKVIEAWNRRAEV